MTGNSLINLGDISKPATVLIEKVSDAVGGAFKPSQIKRVAKAEAEAEITKAIAKIEITELEQRGFQRFIFEESKKQENIEQITAKSLSQLNEEAKPEDIETDWIVNFFDKCRLVSDKEMQILWSNILAGEANLPGTFSKRTINFMSSLDKEDAILFTKLCGFNWIINNNQPLIYNTTAEIYTKHGIYFSTLKHLDAIGLISFEVAAGYQQTGIEEKTTLFYQNTPFILEFQKEKDNNLEIGTVMLTNTGQELADICRPEKVMGFEEYVMNEWIKKGIKLSSPINFPAHPSAN